MPNQSRVTHRSIGSIPGCVPAEPTCKPFDGEAYWTSVQAYRRTIREYIAHMDAVRAGMLPLEQAA